MKMSPLFFSGVMLCAIARPHAGIYSQEPAAYQIVITEIMADPDPPVMLPDAEYIELFNRGTSAVNLEGWIIALGSHKKILPAATIDPGEYFILCESEEEARFRILGKTLPIDHLPAIVNTGQTIILKSPSGYVIHTVTFSDKWYQSRQKSEGGWSLEIIDPDNPCGYSENWSASVDEQGGTPGKKNSVDDHLPDVSSPLLLRATLPSSADVLLLFSERMDSSSISSPWLYTTDKGLLHPASADPVGPDYKAVVLSYPEYLQPSVSYSLTVLSSLKDCAGNFIAPGGVAHFAIPGPAEKNDVVISEILFNPRTGNSEFIELYNRSAKVINLPDLSLALADVRSGVIYRTTSLKNHPFLLFPFQYVVLTDRAQNLPADCTRDYAGSILEIGDLFALPDDEGILVLNCGPDQTMDEFHYNASMHTDFLRDPEGVSLERTDFDKPAGSPHNWHSASSASGYATPCRVNSQYHSGEVKQEEVTLSSEVFSPDQDGLDDQVTLHIQLREPGCMATILIFDMKGEKTTDLGARVLLGTDEYFTWDGMAGDQKPANPGIYIMYAEICSPSGDVKKIKKVITLTR